MKKLAILLASSYVLLTSCATTYQAAAETPVYYDQPQQAGISIDGFYDQLSPYGRWVSYPQYGQVWIPSAGGDFQPYATNGHWVYTDYGWTWASDYSWGWAPFHYGRWLFDNAYGWVWIPGTDWSPAWVDWRTGGDYYGWAPMGPGVTVGVSVGLQPNYWHFVPRQYIASPNIRNYYVDRSRNVTIIHNTTVINNTTIVNNNNYYNRGPRPDEVQRYTRTRVTPVRINNVDRPGASIVSNNRLNIYRPTIRTTTTPANNGGATVRNPNPGNNNVPNNRTPVVTQPNNNVPNRVNDRPAQPANNSTVPSRGNVTQPTQPVNSFPNRGSVTQPTQPVNSFPNRGNVTSPTQPVNSFPNRGNVTSPAQPVNNTPGRMNDQPSRTPAVTQPVNNTPARTPVNNLPTNSRPANSYPNRGNSNNNPRIMNTPRPQNNQPRPAYSQPASRPAPQPVRQAPVQQSRPAAQPQRQMQAPRPAAPQPARTPQPQPGGSRARN